MLYGRISAEGTYGRCTRHIVDVTKVEENSMLDTSCICVRQAVTKAPRRMQPAWLSTLS